jgi:hypothetical protein
MSKACVWMLVLCCGLVAQAQLPDAPSSNASKAKASKHHGIGPYTGSGIVSDPFQPLTAGQKFGFAARQAFGPLAYPGVAFIAGINQATDAEPSWGQGAEGYGKRYGAAFTDQAVGTMLSKAVLPSMFGEDPRYFRQASGTFGQRAGYALSRIFVTRRDNGRNGPNFALLLGAAATAGISRAYYPDVDRTAGNTLRVFGAQIGTAAAWNAFYEFWPDVRHAMFHK